MNNNIVEGSQQAFLYCLSRKVFFKKENTLSDFVLAMCLSSQDFLECFFYFCFPKESSNNIKVYYVEREVDEGEYGRNDFQFFTNKGIYIVESKIGTCATEEQVEKYKEKLGSLWKERLVYIVPDNYSNIKVVENKDVKVVHWNKLAKELFRKQKDNPDSLFNYFAITIASFIGDDSLIQSHDGNDGYIEEKKLCDKLIERIKGIINNDNIDIESFKKDDAWEKCRYYGYQWYYNNLWFGIYHCPIRGLRFYFAAAKTAGVDESFTFNHLKPVGKYFDKNFRYFMLRDNPTIEDLQDAAKEFCRYTKSQSETLAVFLQLE